MGDKKSMFDTVAEALRNAGMDVIENDNGTMTAYPNDGDGSVTLSLDYNF